ncbi:hypothetical protein C7A11_26575 [Pseudomonas simiae]|uniref:hypothetical protein n=1 Tax=Pseudomonas simiae TaxID=321846 RepID=UPI000D025454|nr:hypothetical protein [Pseudomonas simiae]PRW84356.1 hypothetical protein C7A11_26575 [Pseudomonas simiae]
MKSIFSKIKENKVMISFVVIWFTLIPVVVLSILQMLFNFGFLVEFPLIIIMEIIMISMWGIVHRKIPAVKAELMCNDKDVLEGSYDFKDYQGEA